MSVGEGETSGVVVGLLLGKIAGSSVGVGVSVGVASGIGVVVASCANTTKDGESELKRSAKVAITERILLRLLKSLITLAGQPLEYTTLGCFVKYLKNINTLKLNLFC